MNRLGIQLQVMIGPTIPVPVQPQVAAALQSVEVTHSDENRSAFQMTFQVEHGGPAGSRGEVKLNSPLFKVFSRVLLNTVILGRPQVLVDGFITRQEHQPGNEPGVSTLTLTGEDVSVMMDKEAEAAAHPAQDDNVIALKIISKYAKYGLSPQVVPPPVTDPPRPTDWTPTQQVSDLQYLRELAERHAYVFYVTPGPAPLSSRAYWGPPIRLGLPQKALSVNMGPHSNVESINFQHNSLAPTTVSGFVQDRLTNQVTAVQTFASKRPPLASEPDWQVHRQFVRSSQFRQTGLTSVQANARAQAIMDRSMDEVVSATGELDAVRYGDVLQPRGLVGLRGAGSLYDGTYYVKQVSHVISRGSYRQRFTLAREGLGTTTPVVRP